MLRKIILFRGGVETQGFFSEQIEKTFISLGYEVFMFDYNKEAESSFGLLRFITKGETVVLTFNFHGLCNEDLLRDDEDVYIWEELSIPCYNIVVDHPFYYDRFMPQLPKYYCQISIDKNHVDYMRRFYPEVKLGPFIPLGGTELSWEDDELLPMRQRPIDVLFAGSWAEPDFFGEYMKKEGPEYEQFYRGIVDELIRNPDKTFEEVFEPALLENAEDADVISDEQLRDLYSRMVHFDMYIRYFFRGEVVRLLTEGGIKVHCIGGGWNKLNTNKPENLTYDEYSPSIDCLRAMRQAKISLNVMPWFKKGAHDRVFNSMLNGSVCLTDSSLYMDEFLRDGENCLIYNLASLDCVAERVKGALADIESLQQIADKGYAMAKENHTWDERARRLIEFIKKDFDN